MIKSLTSSKRFNNRVRKVLHKLKLGFIVFLISFIALSMMGISSPEARQFLHKSAQLSDVFGATATVVTAVKENVFTDVSASHPNAIAVDFLKRKGIIGGYEDGTFKPDKTITRAELISLIVRTKGARPHNLINSYCFTDVGKEWFSAYVCFAKNNEWVSGFEDGSFHPNENVTRSAALKIVLEAFGVELLSEEPAVAFTDVDASAWYANYVWTAQANGWVETNSESFLPDEEITRAQVAELLYRVVSSEMPLL